MRSGGGFSQSTELPVPPSGVIGVAPEMLSSEYWIARTQDANRVLMTPVQVAAANAKLFAENSAMVSLQKLGPMITRAQVLRWIKETGPFPALPQFDRQGQAIPQSALEDVAHNVGEENVPASVPIRYGMAVRRTILRSFPTALKVYSSRDATDVDNFVGGVLFPGEPVVIAHASTDGKWLLVVATQGPEWVEKEDIAEGPEARVFAYQTQKPFRVVTGDEVRTVFTPEEPRVSEITLDMGTRLPIAELPQDQPVNGQGPFVSWTMELPVRNDDGTLAIKPALLRRTADSSDGYLLLTRANIIRQAFKFLGERYGWGHSYNARDCSGFTSDTYRSMGLLLPSNSGMQGRSPEFRHEVFTAGDTHEKRLEAVMHAQVGDLLVVPGHVMMILGKVDHQPYVIQDVPFAVFHRGNKTQWTKLNEVSVTPLLPLLADEKQTYVDAMTSLVHVTGP